jgi:tetratricopeptide (TPR) repeat protein
MHIFLYPAFFIAERLLYIPSVASCAILVLLASALSRLPRTPPLPPKLLLALLALFWALLLACRNADWLTERAIFDAALQHVPGSSKVQLQSASAAEQAGLYGEALHFVRRTMETDPLGCNVHYFAARTLVRMKEYEAAMSQFSEAFDCAHLGVNQHALHGFVDIAQLLARRNPNEPRWHASLGEVFARMRLWNDSVRSLERALVVRARRNESDPVLFAQLGFAHMGRGNLTLAEQLWDEALQRSGGQGRAHDLVTMYRNGVRSGALPPRD